MRPIKFLHCADIHIGASESFLGVNAPRRRSETLLTFEKILDVAKAQEVDIVLIAGDLFDSNHIEEELVERVFEGFKQISPTPVVITAGNHDPLTADSPYVTHRLPSNVHVFSGEGGSINFEDLSLNVYGKSFTGAYMKASSRFPVPATQDTFNIAVIHGDTNGDINSDYNGITSGFIENSSMDYLALGHIHRRSELQQKGQTFFAYSGCPEGQGFDELGVKGVYVGTLQKGECSLEFVPVCHRQHLVLEIDISACQDSSEITPLILSKLCEIPDYRNQLYKIVLRGSISEGFNIPLNEIAARLSNEVYFIKLRDATLVKADIETISREKSLKGVFVRKILELQEKAIDDKEKKKLQLALDIGLRAFNSEVKYRDDY